MSTRLAVFTGLAILLMAASPAPAPVAAGPLRGTITTIKPGLLQVRRSDGATTAVGFPPDIHVLRVRKIEPSAIRAGSFVATTNVTQADGSGVSTEFRVFTPELRGLGEGNYPMPGEADGTMMTNGTVSAEVRTSPKGREMDVVYAGMGGKGVRHIVIPPTMTIREMAPAAVSDLKPGVGVEIRLRPGAAKTAAMARFIVIGEHGEAPPQ